MPHWNSRNIDPGFDMTPPGPVRNIDPGFYETLPGDIGTLPGRSGGNSSFILYAKQQLDEALELYQQVFQNSANGAGVKE